MLVSGAKVWIIRPKSLRNVHVLKLIVCVCCLCLQWHIGSDTIPDNCTHGDVRLVGGLLAYEGNVEICINGIWSTICDSGWSNNDVKLACAKAGYPGAGMNSVELT